MTDSENKDSPTGRHSSRRKKKDFREGYVPVHGDEKKADELAFKAFGDSDEDGKPDVPSVPFPG